MVIHHVQPIEVLHLFPLLDEKLQELLSSLSDEDWHKQTIAPKWKVRDVAAHLLDGNLRSLSLLRDNYNRIKPGNIETYQDLVKYLDELNAEWVSATQRLSPKIITELLAITGKQYSDFLATLDPWEDAVFPVAWAGEEISKNWFHIAREYSEKWVHQQQVRDAVGVEGIMTRELFHPFIDCLMCALPQTYKDVNVPVGTSVEVDVLTDMGGTWHINKTEVGWVLRKNTRLEPDARVSINPGVAWKLFSKGITPQQAIEQVQIEGDENLGKKALDMVSVMA